jgi:hypothetical protein
VCRLGEYSVIERFYPFVEGERQAGEQNRCIMTLACGEENYYAL